MYIDSLYTLLNGIYYPKGPTTSGYGRIFFYFRYLRSFDTHIISEKVLARAARAVTKVEHSIFFRCFVRKNFNCGQFMIDKQTIYFGIQKLVKLLGILDQNLLVGYLRLFITAPSHMS